MAQTEPSEGRQNLVRQLNSDSLQTKKSRQSTNQCFSKEEPFEYLDPLLKLLRLLLLNRLFLLLETVFLPSQSYQSTKLLFSPSLSVSAQASSDLWIRRSMNYSSGRCVLKMVYFYSTSNPQRLQASTIYSPERGEPSSSCKVGSLQTSCRRQYFLSCRGLQERSRVLRYIRFQRQSTCRTCLMLFLARLRSRSETRFTKPPNLRILLTERLRMRRCQSLDTPLAESIWLLERQSQRRPRLSKPPISYNKFQERSNMRSDLLLQRPFIAVILFEFSFKIRNDRWRPRCGMAVMRLLLRSKQSK